MSHIELDPHDQVAFLISQLSVAQDQIVALRNQLKQKDALIAEMKVANKRGQASAILRDANNFPMIDSVLITFSDIPFKMSEIFDKWLNLIGQNPSEKIARDLKSQMQIMLVRNGIITKTGSQLYRVNKERVGELTKAGELGWSTSTFLEPKA